MAQLGVADMRVPIQYALTYPDRITPACEPTNGSFGRLDLLQTRRLHFEQPDIRRFPCLGLGRAALEAGGAAGCVLNAADEVAVEAFLCGRLRFSDIPHIIERVMAVMPSQKLSSISDVLECDREARQRTSELLTVASVRSLN